MWVVGWGTCTHTPTGREMSVLRHAVIRLSSAHTYTHTLFHSHKHALSLHPPVPPPPLPFFPPPVSSSHPLSQINLASLSLAHAALEGRALVLHGRWRYGEGPACAHLIPAQAGGTGWGEGGERAVGEVGGGRECFFRAKLGCTDSLIGQVCLCFSRSLLPYG